MNNMIELQLSEDELVMIVAGMGHLLKLSEEKNHRDEAEVWDDLILKLKRAAIPRWVFEGPESRQERGPSL